MELLSAGFTSQFLSQDMDKHRQERKPMYKRKHKKLNIDSEDETSYVLRIGPATIRHCCVTLKTKSLPSVS